jgi:hypothetical protein
MARTIGTAPVNRVKKIKNIKRFRPAGKNKPLSNERKEVREVAIGLFAKTFAIGERANAAKNRIIHQGILDYFTENPAARFPVNNWSMNDTLLRKHMLNDWGQPKWILTSFSHYTGALPGASTIGSDQLPDWVKNTSSARGQKCIDSSTRRFGRK